MNQSIDVSRRAFLRGRLVSTPAEGAPRIALIGEDCLAHKNIVCRSCGDLCEHGAIRFRPRLGGAALPEVDGERCTGCSDCSTVCPSKSISLIAVSINTTPTTNVHQEQE